MRERRGWGKGRVKEVIAESQQGSLECGEAIQKMSHQKCGNFPLAKDQRVFLSKGEILVQGPLV